MATFTEEDLRLLDKTIQIRERLIDSIVETELPSKARDIDSFTNLLESVDRSILNKAKVKLEDSNTKINEESKEILRSLLVELHRGSSAADLALESTNSPPIYESIGIEINDGELIEKSDDISLSDIEKTSD
jgi:hypothetical protein